jgi:hypothetical protein
VLRVAILLSLITSASTAAEDTTGLAIVEAGVQQSEDAPFVTTDYQFLPGEYIWVSFHVAGYSVKFEEEKDTRQMDITFSVVPRDQKGIPLAEPVNGEVKNTLGTEDRNWTPVKRASFLIPSFVAGGEHYIHITVHDVLANNKEASLDLPFHIQAPAIDSADKLTVQNFRFFRSEDAREPLDVAAYTPGDTVYATFQMVGFQLADGNTYKLSYGVLVLRPDGKPFVDAPQAAELTDHTFYPAQFLPGTLNIETKKNSPRGEYVVVLTVRDLVAGTETVTRRAFRLE